MAVGIFDSGLGGLTVLNAVEQKLPDASFVYLGDNINTPYGTRDSEDIFALTDAHVKRLWSEGCNLVVLACNTRLPSGTPASCIRRSAAADAVLQA
ncbi:MAG: hypothetical protein AAFQ04_08705, partial [Pseudomonadota bacterium]